jgi:RND family efflux transporter MFP subunit
MTIGFDFGQSVRRGEIIAELDKREFTIQMERTQASLAQALARVGLNPGQEDSNPENTPAIRQAAAQLDDARFKYENASRLVETGDIAKERYIELQKSVQARQAALDSAKDDLRTQMANIRALRAEVRLAQKRLTDATVLAPFDGAVSERFVSPGQYLRENTPIVTLVKSSPLRLRLDLPESMAMEVRVGTSLTFVTDAAQGMEFHAVVRELNPTLNIRTRTLTAEARLVESDPRLRPGTFVQVVLIAERNAATLMVPKEALYSIAGLTKLFVIRNGQAVERKLVPGKQLDGWIEVPAGSVQPGELVATSGLDALVDGAAVQVLKTTPTKG